MKKKFKLNKKKTIAQMLMWDKSLFIDAINTKKLKRKIKLSACPYNQVVVVPMWVFFCFFFLLWIYTFKVFIV